MDEIEAKALSGDLEGLKALQYEETLDNEQGTLTGNVKPYALHPSKPIQQYWSDATQAVDDKLNPPKPLAPFNTVKVKSLSDIDKAFAPAPLLTTVAAMPANQKVGFWMALGNAEASPTALAPQAPDVDLTTPAFRAKVKEAYSKASSTTKKFISSVQGSGAVNEAFNEGKTSFHAVGDLQAASAALHKDAIELPEGAKAYKWLRMEPHMQEALKKSAAGTVLQNPGSTCTSMDPTSTQGFAGYEPSKRARVVYRAAPGAKMVPTAGSGGYQNEQELTALPGARMVLLGTKKMSAPGIAPWFEIEVTLLPPHKNSLKKNGKA